MLGCPTTTTTTTTTATPTTSHCSAHPGSPGAPAHFAASAPAAESTSRHAKVAPAEHWERLPFGLRAHAAPICNCVAPSHDRHGQILHCFCPHLGPFTSLLNTVDIVRLLISISTLSARSTAAPFLLHRALPLAVATPSAQSPVALQKQRSRLVLDCLFDCIPACPPLRPSPNAPTAPHASSSHRPVHAPSTSASSHAVSTLTSVPATATATAAYASVRPQPLFKTKASSASPFQRPLRRLSAARLWNPTNSSRVVPSQSRQQPQHAQRQRQRQPQPQRQHQVPAIRGRAPSSPPPPAVPLSIDPADPVDPVDHDDPIGTGAGDYPLLPLPEQHHVHAASPRASLQIQADRAGSEKRVSLPRSVRHSYDSKRPSAEPEHFAPRSPLSASFGLSFDPIEPASHPESEPEPEPELEPAVSHPEPPATAPRPDKGKQKADRDYLHTYTMPADAADTAAADTADTTDAADAARAFSTDLERGPDAMTNAPQRHSTASMPAEYAASGVSSSNSSIMGDADVQAGDAMGADEWGPQHPCFPHRNPHVSIDDPAYISTRIIRIRRDWLIAGDLAPTFSNLYPEILDPAGMPEHEFRRVVEHLNRELTAIFTPWSLRNIVDGVLGLVTGWLWEDLGLTAAKARLGRLEAWIAEWNDETARAVARDGTGALAPKIIPLRQTGYMTLDVQIGDPEIAPAPPSTPARSQHDIAVEV